MEDEKIVALYWARSEAAIAETSAKYGSYCYTIAHNILSDPEDARECVNDAFLGAWNAIPPHCPSVLSAFLGKLTRRIAIDKVRSRNAKKRGQGELALALEELSECIPSGQNVEQEVERKELVRALNAFVHSLPLQERRVFLCRYWYLDSIASISRRFGFSQSKVKMMLHRTRRKLLSFLEKEDIL